MLLHLLSQLDCLWISHKLFYVVTDISTIILQKTKFLHALYTSCFMILCLSLLRMSRKRKTLEDVTIMNLSDMLINLFRWGGIKEVQNSCESDKIVESMPLLKCRENGGSCAKFSPPSFPSKNWNKLFFFWCCCRMKWYEKLLSYENF